MAKLLVLSVLDSKVAAFAQPFFMRSRGEALRGWEDVCNAADTNFNKYPTDFSLMELGEFDDSTGKFENLPTPLSLGLAAQFIRHKGPQVDIDEVIRDRKPRPFPADDNTLPGKAAR